MTIPKLAEFSSTLVDIRMSTVENMINQGHFTRAVNVIENTIEHLETVVILDVKDFLKDEIVQQLEYMVLLLHCGVDVREDIKKIRTLIKKNGWYTSDYRWSNIIAHRLINNTKKDIGCLKTLPWDILHKIGKEVQQN
jgi:hypothetical protein